MRAPLFSLLLCVFFLSFGQPAWADRRVALVVGMAAGCKPKPDMAACCNPPETSVARCGRVRDEGHRAWMAHLFCEQGGEKGMRFPSPLGGPASPFQGEAREQRRQSALKTSTSR
jgi:hypothetical protein